MRKSEKPPQKRLERHFQPDNMERDEDSLYDHYTLQAAEGQKPLRVDKFLANLLPFTTRSKIKNASQTGSISVNGKEVKVSYKVRAGDEVRLMLPFPPPPELTAEEMDLDIRYEDPYLMVVHKPPGMVVHPSFGHWTGTLIHGLLWHFEKLPGDRLRPGLVHRIDKDTSGLLVIAKEEHAMAHLSKQFFDHTSDRTYHAIAWGDLPEDKGTIIGRVGRSKSDRKKYHNYPMDSDKGKPAITHYEVLERFGIMTLVECTLETGRTHQIRVHMKYLGHPLFNDVFYGGDRIIAGGKTKKFQQFIRNGFQLLPRQALHAKTLAFDHPHSGERMTFDSEWPVDFQLLMEKLRKWATFQE
ncbi:MAG: RluA family pseudouridine synthase [Bacteroidota bacterium]